jgi:ribosomal protein L40E
MSEESDQSFRERVEEIREERASDESRVNTSKDPSEQSFPEIVEQIRQERASGERETFTEKTSAQAQWTIVAVAFLIGGILGAVSNPTQPATGFFVIGGIFAGVAWAFATESGKEFREEVQENMDEAQQQQASSSSQPKRICSECGWQNPQSNNYCHDCGSELGSS